MLDLNQIYNIDALEGLKQLDENSIDAIISDPPYQLTSTRVYPKDTQINKISEQLIKGFMGKEWDVLPSIEILKECHRVLKYGAFSLWLMTPRMDSQVEFVMRLKQAGFNISFTPLYWAYASGFPKSMNIAKAVDKRLGIKPLEIKPASGVGFMNPDNKDWHITKNQIIMPKATSPEAKSLDGSFAGFQPKPAVEVIIVAMKPIKEKTYVDQALLHLKEPEHNQLGGTWLDEARIPYKSHEDYEKATFGNNSGLIKKDKNDYGDFSMFPYEEKIKANPEGRFPANIIVSDNALSMYSEGALAPVKAGQKGFGGIIYGKYDHAGDNGKTFYSDKEVDKSISRYFDLDFWFENKLKELPEEQQKIFPFLYVPKASKSERNKGLEHLPEKNQDIVSNQTNKETADKFGAERKAKMQNIHPTAKPIKLMSYLITLTTRENDIVLDPFTGSGTTAISSILLKRKFIGFEREEEYHKIATERITFYQKQEVSK